MLAYMTKMHRKVVEDRVVRTSQDYESLVERLDQGFREYYREFHRTMGAGSTSSDLTSAVPITAELPLNPPGKGSTSRRKRAPSGVEAGQRKGGTGSSQKKQKKDTQRMEGV